MGNRAKLTEHVGAKKAKGAYAGRKKEAKRESNKLRRLQAKRHADAVEVESGSLKGRRVELVSASRVEAVGQIAVEFMLEVFEFEAGSYLITDESLLTDFVGYGSCDAEPCWKSIESIFGVRRAEVGSDVLADIFETIIAKWNRCNDVAHDQP
jgi:hypothetical protein